MEEKKISGTKEYYLYPFNSQVEVWYSYGSSLCIVAYSVRLLKRSMMSVRKWKKWRMDWIGKSGLPFHLWDLSVNNVFYSIAMQGDLFL